MNPVPPEADAAVLERIARHDELMRVLVADVSEADSTATLVADGRAPDLTDFNHAGLLRSSGSEFVCGLIAFFDKRKRRPAFVLDPGAPAGVVEELRALGFVPEPSASDLMLWNPEARHIYTAPQVYMVMATNATLSAYLWIATLDMPEPIAEQARAMLTNQFRTPGFSFWIGQYGGVPAGICPVFLRDGLAQVGPVIVLPEFRRKGVGLALVNFVTRQSRKDGADVTYVFNEHGGPATGLCETAGYQTVTENARHVWVRQG